MRNRYFAFLYTLHAIAVSVKPTIQPIGKYKKPICC